MSVDSISRDGSHFSQWIQMAFRYLAMALQFIYNPVLYCCMKAQKVYLPQPTLNLRETLAPIFDHAPQPLCCCSARVAHFHTQYFQL